MMNITDVGGLWRVTPGQIENRQTHQVRSVSSIPQDNTLALMHEKTFQRKCKEAFATGTWPTR